MVTRQRCSTSYGLEVRLTIDPFKPFLLLVRRTLSIDVTAPRCGKFDRCESADERVRLPRLRAAVELDLRRPVARPGQRPVILPVTKVIDHAPAMRQG